MMRRLSIAGVGAFLILFAASSAFGQTAPRGEIAAGYQFMRDFDFADAAGEIGVPENFSSGLVISGAGVLNEWIAATGEFGYSRWDSGELWLGDELLLDGHANVYTFMGGPRVYTRLARATVFGQFLLGAARSTGDVFVLGEELAVSETNFALQPGGGVDLHLTNRLGVRAQGDFRRIFYEEEGSNQFRFATGLVVWLGSR
jgi:hypothetical protein